LATVALRLIGTTDVHARVHPHDYYRDAPDERTGLAKAATLIAEARRQAPNSVLFDNGDLIQGSPLGDWAAEALSAGRIKTHPMIAAMNAMGYDAAAVGNHEFNYGLDVLDAALAGAEFPFLCCNALKPDGGPYFKPWTILRKTVRDGDGALHDLNIGVVGFVTPQIVRWDMSHLSGRATASGVLEAARAHVPACRAAGADVIVALCHAGISRTGPAGADENAGLKLAEVGGIDAIFLGHQHLLLPGADFEGIAGVDAWRGALSGVPAVMAGYWGGHIGVIDLTLEAAGGGWRVAGAKAELRPVARSTPADPAPLAATKAAHEATLAYVRAPVGEIEERLSSYFAMIGDDASVRVVHEAQLWYARKAMADAPALAGAPLLSASAPFKCGGRAGPDHYTDVAKGEIALRHVADLYVYPNGLRVVKVAGAMVREWLERAASVFQKLNVEESAPQPLLKPDFAAYDFDSIAGVTYRLDLTQTARYDDDGRLVARGARRVVDLCFEGRPIDDDAPFLIVTNSYRAGGGGHFPGCDGSAIVYEAPDSNFDALLQFVRARRRVAVGGGMGWRFVPWPATVAATLLAPPAAVEIAPPPGVRVAPLGPGPEGLLRFRVTPQG
jgi:2',3'-cyclic-nucleotide 2'-phosphodiesterase/3'-nucleotidase